ncbi:MAG: tetratricopeptide repeat protein [Candidatus Omnitrophica bacterium]|nr:tetratricopeptide repeat protein [Candidatus Omnitrophota bacterium]MDD5670891.1 tetratricopeptide repeat protein [Candidatus Omnitrophota bacterium]
MRKIWLCLFLMLVVTGCSKNYMAEREYYQAQKVLDSVKSTDVEAFGAKAYDPAVAAFQKVVDKYPGTPKALESLFVVSNLCLQQEKYDQAIETLRKVTVNFPDSKQQSAEALFRIGAIYDKKEEWGKAESIYWEVAEYHPLEQRGLQAPIEVIMHYAKINYPDAQKRAFQQALDQYKKTLDRIGPIQASMEVRNYVGVAYSVMGDLKAARKEWVGIANDFHDLPAAASALIPAAEASLRLQQPRAAVALYEQYLKRVTKGVTVGQMNVRLGMLYHRLGEYAKARNCYEKAAATFGPGSVQMADVELLIAKSYQAQGNWDEARKRYHALEEKYPDSIAAMQVPLMIAAYFQDLGDKATGERMLDNAIAKYKKIAADNPGTNLAQIAQRLLNDAFVRKGDWTQVMAQLDESMKRAPNAEEKGKLLLMKAMLVETRVKDKQLALKLYNEFITDYANHPLVEIAKRHQELLAKGQPVGR